MFRVCVLFSVFDVQCFVFSVQCSVFNVRCSVYTEKITYLFFGVRCSVYTEKITYLFFGVRCTPKKFILVLFCYLLSVGRNLKAASVSKSKHHWNVAKYVTTLIATEYKAGSKYFFCLVFKYCRKNVCKSCSRQVTTSSERKFR